MLFIRHHKFLSSHQNTLEKPQWIIDGNFHRTLPHRLEYCDAVFFFDLPIWSCLWGITKRVFENYGKTRPDMGGNCPEHFDAQKISLYRNVLLFNRQHRKEYYKLLENTPHVKVTVFRKRRQVKVFLNNCQEYQDI